MKTDRFLVLVLTVVFIGLLYNLHTWGIGEGTEAQFAEISREMLRSGDYLHPRLLGIDLYQPPPLSYWLISLGMHWWGVNAFGARFFVQVALIAQAGLLYPITLRLFGTAQVALFASLIYLALPLVLWGSRTLSVEVFLTTFELGAIYSLLVYYLEKRPWALYGLATCLGLGFLTAGFRIFLLPCLVGLYVLIFGQTRPGVHRQHGLFALLLGLGLALGWYLSVAVGKAGFWENFRQTYFLDMFFQTLTFSGHWWQLPLVLSCASLPWLLIFVMGLAETLWQNRIVAQLSLFWLLVPTLVLAVGRTTAPLSFLSVFSGLAIVLGYLTYLLSSLEIKRFSVFFLQFYGVISVLAFSVPLFSQLFGGRMRLTWPMAVTAVGTMLIATTLFRLIRTGVRFRLVAISLVASLMLMLYGGYFRLANSLWVETTQPLVQFIQAKKLQDLPILVYDETLPSLAFNLDRDIITIDDGQVTPDVRFQTRRDWRQYWIQTNQPSSVQYLRRLISTPSVWVVAGDLPERWHWIRSNYPRVERAGRWQVLYRPPQ
jgi:4-amino-4-deoxy-L-arabinose transferase-like glycosyltransferase